MLARGDLQKEECQIIYPVSQNFKIVNVKCFILEGPETRATTSRYSATGKTTTFLLSGLVDEDTEPHIISTFKEDLKNRLVPGSSYKLPSTTNNQYGYELKTDSIVRRTCPDHSGKSTATLRHITTDGDSAASRGVQKAMGVHGQTVEALCDICHLAQSQKKAIDNTKFTEKFSSEMGEDYSTPVKAICPDVDHEEVVQMSDCGWRQWRSLVELGIIDRESEVMTVYQIIHL
uniref:Uncharacterized protein n=1 Tax=Magallana gigas TaxID=29159 RepID=A0A8W8MQI1_MAGGI